MNVKKILTSLLTKNDIVIEGRRSAKYTLATNTNSAYSFDISKAGYRPIGIAGYWLEWFAGQTALLNIYQMQIDGNKVQFSLRNMHTSNTQFDLYVNIIYQKIIGGGYCLKHILASIVTLLKGGVANVKYKETAHENISKQLWRTWKRYSVGLKHTSGKVIRSSKMANNLWKRIFKASDCSGNDCRGITKSIFNSGRKYNYKRVHFQEGVNRGRIIRHNHKLGGNRQIVIAYAKGVCLC